MLQQYDLHKKKLKFLRECSKIWGEMAQLQLSTQFTSECDHKIETVVKTVLHLPKLSPKSNCTFYGPQCIMTLINCWF